MANRFCKKCGAVAVENHNPEHNYMYSCTGCDATGNGKDFVAKWTLDARMSQLKAMHDIMCEANDETLYMTWIYLMPDCPSEEDFFDIALDEEEYAECFDLFIKLVQKDGMRW